MEHFLEQNQIWLVPIITILLTVIIKMSARNQSVDFRGIDFLDFGFDLSISAIVVLLTNVRDSNLCSEVICQIDRRRCVSEGFI